MPSDATERLIFEALLTPHRSLSVRGARAIVITLLVISGIVSLRFWLLGAWPVVLFSLIDVPLVGVLLALSFRQARASECLLLTSETLTVVSTAADGSRRKVSLPTSWLRVELQSEADAPRIVARSHGRTLEIAAFLPATAKRDLYDALGRALHDVRHPVFDNPQLRDR